MKMPIVVIAYNRRDSLSRLLKSLQRANYNKQEVELIISIDKSYTKEVYEEADSFIWEHGTKKIIKHKENLGLRNHVLKCGDLALKYDGIIMLEDDLVVSPSFYQFAMESARFYNDDDDIGGISLFTYRISEFSNLRTFIPLQDESDTFFMKVPSSWGQIWTNEQWGKFREWYNNKSYEQQKTEGLIPQNAQNWPESSWKKYFYMYLALKNKYIVYPRIGLSTNMGDVGTHHKRKSTEHQSILMGNFKRSYIFKLLKESICKYDQFMESEYLKEFLNLDVAIDYYGIKTNQHKKRYLLSTQELNYKILKKWDLSLKPYEMNIIYDIGGEKIFLYDTKGEKKKIVNEQYSRDLISYELPGITKEKALKVAYSDYKKAFLRKFKIKNSSD